MDWELALLEILVCEDTDQGGENRKYPDRVEDITYLSILKTEYLEPNTLFICVPGIPRINNPIATQ